MYGACDGVLVSIRRDTGALPEFGREQRPRSDWISRVAMLKVLLLATCSILRASTCTELSYTELCSMLYTFIDIHVLCTYRYRCFKIREHVAARLLNLATSSARTTTLLVARPGIRKANVIQVSPLLARSMLACRSQGHKEQGVARQLATAMGATTRILKVVFFVWA